MTGILLVDDHPLLSLGLQAQLAQRGYSASMVEIGRVEDLFEQVVCALPALVVLDLGLPYDGGGAALVGPLVGLGASVLVLTGEHDVELWARCFESGAIGVVGKDEPLPSILRSIERAHGGEPVDSHQKAVVMAEARFLRSQAAELLVGFEKLTEREEMVLRGLVHGLVPAEIAARDFVSIETVRSQIKAVMRKIGVSSQLEAVAKVRIAGWDRRCEEKTTG